MARDPDSTIKLHSLYASNTETLFVVEILHFDEILFQNIIHFKQATFPVCYTFADSEKCFLSTFSYAES